MSFLIDIVGSIAFGVLDLVTVIVLFRVTPTLTGFTFPEAFLMTALASTAFALADLVVGNVERLRLASVATQHQPRGQGPGDAIEHVAHRGIELCGAPAHAERARIEREDLRHDGT